MADGLSLANLLASMYAGQGQTGQDAPDAVAPVQEAAGNDPAAGPNPNATPGTGMDAGAQPAQAQAAAPQAGAPSTAQGTPMDPDSPKPQNYAGMGGLRNMQGSVWKNPYHF